MAEMKLYNSELNTELDRILNFWATQAPDPVQGGFRGRISNNNFITADAPKGLVLHARILWTFSAAFNFKGDPLHLQFADRAWNYLHNFFLDKNAGGLYWKLDANGRVLDGRKQIYGQAFYLYGLSEYYKACKQQALLEEAIAMYRLIESKSNDRQRMGYYEAFAQDWTALADLRLSEKDANESKTMNTHLHLVEAYANLYYSWPHADLKKSIQQLLEIFDRYMIDKTTGHLLLFFDEDWQHKPDIISYGHDIEASWLLLQCAEIINDSYWISRMKENAVLTAHAAATGLDLDGGLWYEYDPALQQFIKEKHWWPQAEAMLGFYNAWQLTGQDMFLNYSVNSWQFIKKHLLDTLYGEWYWGINENHQVLQEEDKAGFWKCPYHNSRACMEIVKRIAQLNLQ